MSDRRVLVIGAGGHAKVVIATLQASGRVIGGVLDDGSSLERPASILGAPVLGPTELAPAFRHFEAIIAVGDNALRRRLAERLDLDWTIAVHPSAIVSPDHHIGPGTVIFAGAVIQPAARIGAHVIVNTSATIDHDCSVGDYSHIAPGAHLGGTVTVAEGVFLGIASVVLPNLRIGEWATLGGGAVAVRDIEPHTVAIGVPARCLRSDAPPKTQPAQRSVPIRGTFIGPADPRWRAILNRVPHDVYHLPEYLGACAVQDEARPLAFYAEDDNSACLIPLLLKAPPAALAAPSWWNDLISPYGYSSPLFTDAPSEDRKAAYLRALVAAARELGASSILLRLHPILCPDMQTGAPLSKFVRGGDTVAIDLKASEDEMWAHTRDGHRSDIRRLEHLKYTPVMDDWTLYGDFVRMYRATMTRIGANSYYQFGDDYFRLLKDGLGDALHLCCVLAPDGQPACGGLFTTVGDIAQYHLSGSDERYQRFAPTKLMLHFARTWCKQRGVSVLHLGGGASSQHDTLFAFKAGFSPQTHRFATVRFVADEQRYATLALRAGKSLNPQGDLDAGYFPAYRQPA